MSEPIMNRIENPNETYKYLSCLGEKTLIFFQKITYIFVVLFCFLFFPIYLLHSSLSIYFDGQLRSLKQEKLREMTKILEYMEKYSNNKRYFHFLFSKISKFAQTTDDSAGYMKINIENLKKQYPNKLEFIVWDHNGNIVKELSDRATYSYIIGKLYESLKLVTSAVNADSSIRVSNLESVKKNFNIFRNFLGKIFISENLKYPIIDGNNAGPFITELGQNLSYVWFAIESKLSFLCFISKELIEDFTGIDKITQKFNAYKKDIITGFAISPRYELPTTNFPKEYEADLSLALTTFENAGDSIFENDKSLVKMSMPQSNIRAFCYLRKEDDSWNIGYKRDFWFWILTSSLLSIYLFFGSWFLYKKYFISIRWKLTALFLFANMAPICILGIIAKGYLENKSFSLKNGIMADLEKKLREFDANYDSLFDKYAFEINEKVDKIAEKVGNLPINEETINNLKEIYYKYECSEFYLIASSSRIIDLLRDENKAEQKTDFMSSFGEAVLSYSNKKFVNAGNHDFVSNMLDPEYSEFVRNSIKNLRRVTELKIGLFSKIYYSNILGDRANYNGNYFVILTWEKNEFQNIFLNKFFKQLTINYPKTIFYIKSNDGKNIYGPEKLSIVVNSILEKNSGMAEKITGSIDLDGKKNIYVSFNGNGLKGWNLLALFPEDHIDKKLNLFIAQIVAGAFLSFLLTIIVGHILSLQFLEPIHNMGKAALAIGDRKFNHRIPIGDNDEFGHLNKVFNRVIEGLGDFEVAKIVQESLFPGNHFNVGEFNIFGRSVVMTTLGGDYYDCFEINEEYQGIIIGDVAGHGIPAGLMMAMAKSGVLTASDEIKLDPSALTTRLHKAFFAIKNEKLKRMMTFQYFVLRIKDGHFTYTNAGHCFPIIIDPVNKTAKFIDYIATPLGIGPKCRCKNQEFTLEKGQSLVLYTDGIVEANNEKNEQYGYDRYKEALIKYYDPDPEVFYYNLYDKVYKLWSSEPDDDLTLIFVNRN